MCRRHRGAIAYTPNVVLSSEYYQEQPFSHLEVGGNASKANSCQAGCNISQNMKLQQQSRSYLPVWKQGKLPSVSWGVNYVPFPSPCPLWPQVLQMTMHVNMKNLQSRFKIHPTFLQRGYAFDKLLQEVVGFFVYPGLSFLLSPL